MAVLHLLGTGAAITDPHRTTTMLAFESERSVIVVDCGGDVIQRMMQAGISSDNLEAMIVTHEHPDHVSGFPLFMEKIWLAKRRRPIAVCGIRPAIEQAQRSFGAFDTSDWQGLPEIQWREVALRENAPVFEDEQWLITASPGVHAAPVIALRVEDRQRRSVVTYSCDTEPCDAVAQLAHGADILVHEATGDIPGHTSAETAAQIAAEAGVRRLLLVHLPPENELPADRLALARKVFPQTEKGGELGRYEF